MIIAPPFTSKFSQNLNKFITLGISLAVSIKIMLTRSRGWYSRASYMIQRQIRMAPLACCILLGKWGRFSPKLQCNRDRQLPSKPCEGLFLAMFHHWRKKAANGDLSWNFVSAETVERTSPYSTLGTPLIIVFRKLCVVETRILSLLQSGTILHQPTGPS